ncbi:protein zinc induced facilitator-LIKE 1 [Dichotomopilus funicola]|uniref:Protein zinc induced facilitator-LIKE 1 n=1 Tax=Dichotomopilus funicola TaxID=1934379 RepID=A0AAN6UX67_9PEZI|nr:protein zinc induced facilitator-LIKE 1 [Dichotomopilus funicola]
MSSISNIRLQIWVLGLIRATEAIAWSSIFPYAYFMIQSFNVPEHDIAFYSAALIALFTLGEFLTGIVWARVSDKIGRKPTMLMGTFCGFVTVLTLGFSRSVGVAMASRAFGGLLNPNVGLVQTSTGELASKEQRPKAFSLVTFIRSVGDLIGPVLGGLLADPATLYPSVFPQNSLWTSYPYLLPNLVVGMLQALTFILTFFVLQETHPGMSRPSQATPGHSVVQAFTRFFSRRDKHPETTTYTPLLHGDPTGLEAQQGPTEDDPLLDQQQQQQTLGNDARTYSDSAFDPSNPHSPPPPNPAAPKPPSPFRAFPPQVILQVLALSLLPFHKIASDSLTSTFLALDANDPNDNEPASGAGAATTTTPRGTPLPHSQRGFGFDTRMIGIIFLTEAIFRVLIQPTAIPWFVSKLGALRPFHWVLELYPAMYIFTPFLPQLPSPFGVVLLLLDLWTKVALSSVGYICSAVLITNTSPSSEALARINGAAASFSCLARSAGLLLSGGLFGAGLQLGYLQIPFWTLGAVALVGAIEAGFLVDHS